jgi:hypothetical protein
MLDMRFPADPFPYGPSGVSNFIFKLGDCGRVFDATAGASQSLSPSHPPNPNFSCDYALVTSLTD